MPLLLHGVPQEEAAQQRVARALGGAGQVAAAGGLGVREAQELAAAPIRVGPDPAVQRPQQPVDGRRYGPHQKNVSTRRARLPVCWPGSSA